MKLFAACVCFAFVCSAADSVRAQDFGGLQPSIYDGDPVGDVSSPEPMAPRAVRRSRVPTILGTTALVLGGVGAFVVWPLYASRTSHRLRSWSEVTPEVLDGFESRGAWTFWSALAGSTFLCVGEQLLLPPSKGVPTLAWLSGALGLGVTAVGLAYAAGGTHCGPQAYGPGSRVERDCLSATSDALFGPLLMITALPLLWAPLTYGLRALFTDSPTALTV
ncbi:MAG TPA: hypothetical protein VMF89_12715, partial [Polyangiales bacterium]|nr:hypothetical protein [Polyangiales bacterium]